MRVEVDTLKKGIAVALGATSGSTSLNAAESFRLSCWPTGLFIERVDKDSHCIIKVDAPTDNESWATNVAPHTLKSALGALRGQGAVEVALSGEGTLALVSSASNVTVNSTSINIGARRPSASEKVGQLSFDRLTLDAFGELARYRSSNNVQFEELIAAPLPDGGVLLAGTDGAQIGTITHVESNEPLSRRCFLSASLMAFVRSQRPESVEVSAFGDRTEVNFALPGITVMVVRSLVAHKPAQVPDLIAFIGRYGDDHGPDSTSIVGQVEKSDLKLAVSAALSMSLERDLYLTVANGEMLIVTRSEEGLSRQIIPCSGPSWQARMGSTAMLKLLDAESDGVIQFNVVPGNPYVQRPILSTQGRLSVRIMPMATINRPFLC